MQENQSTISDEPNDNKPKDYWEVALDGQKKYWHEKYGTQAPHERFLIFVEYLRQKLKPVLGE